LASLTINVKGMTAPSRTFVDAAVTTGSDLITIPDHNLQNGDIVRFTNSGGALPGGLTSGHPYYVISRTAGAFKVSETAGGSAVDISSAAGGGTHTVTLEESKFTDLLNQASDAPKEAALALSRYFEAVAAGYEAAVVDVHTSPANPVAASGTITLVYDDLAADDTIVIGGTTLTCKTAAPANESQFRKVTDLATTVTNLMNCINRHSVLGRCVTATNPSAGVVTVTCKLKGYIGNAITWSATDATPTAIVLDPTTALSGGTGGPTGAATTYTLGL
jgi:hypothetical protein